VDNPFVGAQWYVDPIWSAKAAAEPGGSAIANQTTAVWMDRIGAITQTPGGLREHLNNAVSQGANMFMFIVYDLPNRDCAALASNGELLIAQNGMARYRAEYIDPIVSILADFPQLRIVTIIEVDSLPNLVTNLSVAACNEANGPGGYREGITYALNRLGTLSNVYSYIDIAHSGWLGWPNNFSAAAPIYETLIEGTTLGWGSVAGFASNSANYTPVEEPFLPDPNLNIGGQPVKQATFYEFNDYLEELDWVQDWRDAMIGRGAPSTIGMLIDTGRNGWGGAGRPTAASTSTNNNTYADQSRIDRRLHRGNWCNQPGGVGFRPQAAPHPGVDAYVWIKPQGESDGISEPNFTPDPNDPAKKHDPMCDPDANNRYNAAFKTGALDNAPHAGRWYPEAFRVLLQNAYPPL
jgi:cellulose 1,4-beta-cellobiosidase